VEEKFHLDRHFVATCNRCGVGDPTHFTMKARWPRQF